MVYYLENTEFDLLSYSSKKVLSCASLCFSLPGASWKWSCKASWVTESTCLRAELCSSERKMGTKGCLTEQPCHKVVFYVCLILELWNVVEYTFLFITPKEVVLLFVGFTYPSAAWYHFWAQIRSWTLHSLEYKPKGVFVTPELKKMPSLQSWHFFP